jgi:hypothetical protein
MVSSYATKKQTSPGRFMAITKDVIDERPGAGPALE